MTAGRPTCKHPGCSNHVTHPCEKCGYQSGITPLEDIEREYQRNMAKWMIREYGENNA